MTCEWIAHLNWEFQFTSFHYASNIMTEGTLITKHWHGIIFILHHNQDATTEITL